jgi:CRISPR-associated endonuclease Csn1
MQYRLALDLGPSSIGWAVATDDSLIDLGVRIFPMGLDAKTKSKTPASERRAARLARRLIRRRAARLRKIRGLFRGLGVEKVSSTCPFKLRRDGMSQPLEVHELARVVLHCANHRGVILKGATEDDDTGSVKRAITALESEMAEAGLSTYADYALSLIENGVKLRGAAYTLRSTHKRELQLVLQEQSKHHAWLTPSMQTRLMTDVFYQRPLRSTSDLVGECALEKGRKRAHSSHPVSQDFRIAETLAHLRVYESSSWRPLSDHERSRLWSILSTGESLTRTALASAIGATRTNLTRLSVRGNTTRALVWAVDAAAPVDQVSDILLSEGDRLAKCKALHALLPEASRDIVDQLVGIKLPRGRAKLSLRAMRRLTPHLRLGLSYQEACAACGYSSSSQAPETLGLMSTDGCDEIMNPIVRAAVYELSKVVNAVVRKYGHPSQVVVELARQAKMGRKDRDRYQLAVHRSEEQRKRGERAYARVVGSSSPPSSQDVLRYRLWEECGGVCSSEGAELQSAVCVYTGKSITLGQLFTTSDFDVEHIVPRSRLLDDSMKNKTLCCRLENRVVKRGRTPFEAYGDQPERYADLLSRVKASKMKRYKRSLFELEEVDVDQAASNALNDTQYISTHVAKLVRRVSPDVVMSRGDVTAYLRSAWGLGSVLGGATKNRMDHRHHAVDAAVLAFTTRSAIHRLSQAMDASSERGVTMDPPYAGFSESLSSMVRGLAVSHAPRRKVRGALMEDTVYGKSPDGDYVLKGKKKSSNALFHPVHGGKGFCANASYHHAVLSERDGVVGLRCVSTLEVRRRIASRQPMYVRDGRVLHGGDMLRDKETGELYLIKSFEAQSQSVALSVQWFVGDRKALHSLYGGGERVIGADGKERKKPIRYGEILKVSAKKLWSKYELVELDVLGGVHPVS